MSKPKNAKPPEPKRKNPNALEITADPNRTPEEQLADLTMSGPIRNALIGRKFGDIIFANDEYKSDIDRCVEITNDATRAVRDGDLSGVTDTLTAQLVALDALFTGLVSKAGANMGEYPQAVDRYMGWAMKAQAACRTTAETLARIKRGGKQTVKVVHVHEGGQAVVADTVNHNRTGGVPGEGEGHDGQPHEQGAQRASLPSPDPSRDGVPLPGYEGTEAMPAARG